MIAADAMCDAVLARDAAAHTADDTFTAPIQVGDNGTPATAHYHVDGRDIVVDGWSAGPIYMDAADLHPGALRDYAAQVARFIRGRS